MARKKKTARPARPAGVRHVDSHASASASTTTHGPAGKAARPAGRRPPSAHAAAPHGAASPGAASAPSPMRILVLGGMGLFLAAIFLGSFFARMSQDTLREDRGDQQPRQAGSAMGAPATIPPEMQAKMQEKTANGSTSMPQGKPGAAMANMDPAAMGKVGALMKQMREQPNNATLLLQLADEFMHLKDFEAVESFASRAVIAAPGNVDALLMLGVSLFNLERFDEAAQQFDTIVKLEPDNAGAHFNLGLIYKHFINQPDEGERHLRRVLELNPADKRLAEEARKALEAPAMSLGPEGPEGAGGAGGAGEPEKPGEPGKPGGNATPDDASQPATTPPASPAHVPNANVTGS